MNFRQTLQAVDTLKALTILGIEGSGNGSYAGLVYAPVTSPYWRTGSVGL